MKAILIRKADGGMEPFHPDKLNDSLTRSGASKRDADKIVSIIQGETKEGDETSEIYQHAFKHLRHIHSGLAARYSLRRALAALGPSGFPFEKFIARVFQAGGYSTKVGEHLSGKCATHEIDLIANNGKKFIIGEIKFHNKSKIKSDMKVALYVQARFEDLVRSEFDGRNPNKLPFENWLITNTKFTTNVLKYAKCMNMKMLGWSYPHEGNLQDLIEKYDLEPVTMLTTLSSSEKKELVEKGIVLCSGIVENEEILKRMGITGERKNEVLSEVHYVCKI